MTVESASVVVQVYATLLLAVAVTLRMRRDPAAWAAAGLIASVVVVTIGVLLWNIVLDTSVDVIGTSLVVISGIALLMITVVSVAHALAANEIPEESVVAQEQAVAADLKHTKKKKKKKKKKRNKQSKSSPPVGEPGS